MPARPRLRRLRRDGDERLAEPAVVVSGRALLHGRLQPAEFGLDDTGTIVRVARSLHGGERFDYGDLVLLPAAVDLHVHFRQPGGPDEVENLRTGTIQAALGGVGVVADMPNNQPPMDSVDRLESKTSLARHRLAVDLLLYAAARPGLPIASLARAAGAFKLYLSPTTSITEPPARLEIPGLLREVAATGLPLSVHAEDPSAFRAAPPAVDTLGWDAGRPTEAERRGVDLLWPPPPSLRLNIAHVTDATTARRLTDAGQAFEATAHHLLLAAKSGGDARGKVNPPLRTETERSQLFEEFREGRIPFLASDHAPHAKGLKELPFDRAPSGIPSVETTLPLFLNLARSGEVPLRVLERAAMDRPARWLGLPVGRLAVGHQGDFLVVDFRHRREIRARDLHSECGWTPYEGRMAVFPRHHLRRGAPIVEDGEYVGTPSGEIVRPEFAP